MLRGRVTILLRQRFNDVNTVDRNRTSAGQFNSCLLCKLHVASPEWLISRQDQNNKRNAFHYIDIYANACFCPSPAIVSSPPLLPPPCPARRVAWWSEADHHRYTHPTRDHHCSNLDTRNLFKTNIIINTTVILQKIIKFILLQFLNWISWGPAKNGQDLQNHLANWISPVDMEEKCWEIGAKKSLAKAH